MTENNKSEKCVLPPSMSGGPKGLGDPDDKSLRIIESDILIHKLMREKSEELCDDKRKALTACLKTCSNFLTILRCRPETRDLRMCQYDWFQDENFKKKVTDDYIEMRSEYRRTGKTKQMRDNEKKREAEFLKWKELKEKKILENMEKS